ncbi:MAG: tRNA (adenosine(37)-N6)-threonylcarbamoyltransferase complex dimerization subunit type 1 TsaB [Rhodobacter sp.]|nr:tRNA (adenosine(37)-N6)-threonylcarbamoyltransferase complex dimerization subunit type 1 TsaB [Rhodobacter sp.]
MPSDPLILGFDTSAAHCAAVLLCGDTVLADAHEEMTKGQAERLIPMLEQVLTQAGAGWGDLAALGVGIGPGNFTGVRISVSAARGLALGLGIPAVGVSALEAQVFGLPGVTVSSLDARRDALYVQVFEMGAPHFPVLCDMASLPPIPARAAPSCIGHMNQEIAARCAGHAKAAALPMAEAIARIAGQRMHNDTLKRPAPLYLRGADAAPPRAAPPVILS